MTEYFQDESIVYNHTNHHYIEIGDAKILVDAGSGSRLFPTTGRLIQNMEAAGVDPFYVTHVPITHAHPDHNLGVRDDFDEAMFMDAEHVVGETEHVY